MSNAGITSYTVTHVGVNLWLPADAVPAEWVGYVDMVIPDVSLVVGDFDGNGVVNGLDIPDFKSALADPGAWAADNPDLPHPDDLGDFDGNGTFNGLDIPGFKDTLAGAAVPEPLTLMLLSIGAAGLLRRRRTR